MSHDPTRSDPRCAGDALRRLVDLTSHRSGAVFALMNEAAVTLPQLLLRAASNSSDRRRSLRSGMNPPSPFRR